jgi:hypothetical protein
VFLNQTEVVASLTVLVYSIMDFSEAYFTALDILAIAAVNKNMFIHLNMFIVSYPICVL